MILPLLKKYSIIYYIFFIPITFHSLPLEQELIQIRFSYYQQQTKIPASQFMQDTYQEIKILENGDQKNLLFSYWGILASELSLYYSEHDHLDLLTSAYKEHKKNIKKTKSSQVLQQTGELALLMLKLDEKNTIKYLMDARTFFMRSLQKDSKNISAKIGLGNWWAYDVVTEDHMEYNHSVAQAQKYLALKNIVPFEESKEDWDKITAFNAYQTLAILELRVLNTSKSLSYLDKSSLLFPNAIMGDLFKKYYKQNRIEWF